MFLNNVRKNVKARIGVSIVLQDFASSFSHFPRSDGGNLAAISCIALGKLRHEARQAGYLAGYISAEVGKFLKPVPVIFTFSERGKRVHSLQ